MKKTFLKSVLATFLIAISLLSCDNDETSSPPPPGLAEFLYAEAGAISMTSVTNPFAYTSTKKIIAKTDGNTIIEISLESLAVGTYTIGATNHFIYNKPLTTSTWTAILGTVTITSNALK